MTQRRVNKTLADREVNRLRSRIMIAVLAVLGWFLSGAIHELGHVVAAKMAGLQVIHLQPWALLGRVQIFFVVSFLSSAGMMSGAPSVPCRAVAFLKAILATPKHLEEAGTRKINRDIEANLRGYIR